VSLIGEDFHDARFFDLVDLGGLPPHGSLEAVSGMKSGPGPHATSLIERGETAWRTRFCALSCAQVSLLVEQKMGLQWLGRPAIAFATRYPLATIQYYPGEMGVFCLRAGAELARFAQPEFGVWVSGNSSWIQKAFGWSPDLLREVNAELKAARTLLRAQ
jgi:hypothetical protein